MAGYIFGSTLKTGNLTGRFQNWRESMRELGHTEVAPSTWSIPTLRSVSQYPPGRKETDHKTWIQVTNAWSHTPLDSKTKTAPCFPQEIPENGADVAHLSQVHGPSLMAGTDLRFIFNKLFAFNKHDWQAEWSPMPEPDGHVGLLKLSVQLSFWGFALPFPNMYVVGRQVGLATSYRNFFPTVCSENAHWLRHTQDRNIIALWLKLMLLYARMYIMLLYYIFAELI